MDLQLNLLDLGLLVILAFTGVRGFARGLVDEVAGFIGIIAGIYLASHFYKSAMPALSGFIHDHTWQAIVAWALIFVAALFVVAFIANTMRKFFQATSTTFVNQILGCLVGLAKGLFLCAVLLGLMDAFIPDAAVLHNSAIAPYLQKIIALIRSQLPDLQETQKNIMKNLPLGGLR